MKGYKVQLALSGIKQKSEQNVLEDLKNELKTRSHIQSFDVEWDIKEPRVIVHFDVEGIDPDPTVYQMAEELLEIASAILFDFDRIHIDILGIEEHDYSC